MRYIKYTHLSVIHDMNNNEHILSPAPPKRLHTMLPKQKNLTSMSYFFLLQLYRSIGQIMIKLHFRSDVFKTVILCVHLNMKHKRDAVKKEKIGYEKSPPV